jgi:hypothetical protein
VFFLGFYVNYSNNQIQSYYQKEFLKKIEGKASRKVYFKLSQPHSQGTVWYKSILKCRVYTLLPLKQERKSLSGGVGLSFSIMFNFSVYETRPPGKRSENICKKRQSTLNSTYHRSGKGSKNGKQQVAFQHHETTVQQTTKNQHPNKR